LFIYFLYIKKRVSAALTQIHYGSEVRCEKAIPTYGHGNYLAIQSNRSRRTEQPLRTKKTLARRGRLCCDCVKNKRAIR
jgi:hypothetical protein